MTPPKAKKQKVIWNNNDCKADVCIRPEGTASWVQCDDCKGWYHVACLFLDEEKDLGEEKDFYCPNCYPDKKKEFQDVQEHLFRKVEELSGRQQEFGGVTISRDMFREKKSANTYNYSTDFPPTLRDLGARIKNKHCTISDFKFDYKNMCKRLTEELKDDYESRVQMIEWELDDIVEELFKEPEEEEETEEDAIEYDLDKVKGERDDSRSGAICEYCSSRFRNTQIYGCKRNHKMCDGCRKIHPGCICPICYERHGDRKRLALDTAAAWMWRMAHISSEEVDNLTETVGGPKNRKRRSQDSPLESGRHTSSPQITSVWSCTESSSSIINIEGPIVKAEPEYHLDEEIPTLDMSTVLSDGKMSNQLLQLIDSSILADPGDLAGHEPQIVEEQQPNNYNDTENEDLDDSSSHTFALSESEINQHIQSIQEPVSVSSEERNLISLREELNKLKVLQSKGVEVGTQIRQHKQEIDRLKQTQQQYAPEAVDPWQALEQLQEACTVSQSAVNHNQQLGNTSWAQFKARATSKTSSVVTQQQQQAVLLKSNPSQQAAVHQYAPPQHNLPLQPTTYHYNVQQQEQILKPPAMQENRQKVLEARGCRCEILDSSVQEHSFNGPLSFSLLKNYSGSNLEWRPFLSLFAATGPEMYQFQLGRAGHVFYIRAVTSHIENCRDHWTIQLINTSILMGEEMVSKGGLFTYTGELDGVSDTPPHVLPTTIGPGDIRHFIITVTQ